MHTAQILPRAGPHHHPSPLESYLEFLGLVEVWGGEETLLVLGAQLAQATLTYPLSC
jgi:hypothetical protein